MEDYSWTDGTREHVFKGDDAFERAKAVWEIYGSGQIWRRVFDESDYLEAVTNVTPEKRN